MAYSPIAFIAPNYSDYGTYWLKAYSPGSTTTKALAISPAASPTVAKLQINVDGFFKSAGGALVTPYVDGAYDAYLFPTEADADANNTSSAIRIADDITPTDISFQAQLDTEEAARIAGDSNLAVQIVSSAAATANTYAASSGAALIGTAAGSTVQSELDGLTAGQTGGIIVFATYALLDAYTPTTTQQELGSFKVTNDSTSSLNGYYSWVSGTTYTKDAELANGAIVSGNPDAVNGGTVFNTTNFKADLIVGKNIIDEDSSISGFYVGGGSGNLIANAGFHYTDYVPLLPNTIYTLSTQTGSTAQFALYDAGKVFTEGFFASGNDYEFTTGASSVFARFSLDNNATLNMAELGSLKTEFEAYAKGVDTNQIKNKAITQVKFADDVTFVNPVAGKNKIDVPNATAGFFVSYTNGNIIANAGFSATDYMELEPNTVYVKSSSGVNAQLALYDENKTYTEGFSATANSYVFTTGATSVWGRFSIDTGSDTSRDQLERGTIVTPHESYRLVVPSVSVERGGFGFSYLSSAVRAALKSYTVVTVDINGGSDFTSVRSALDSIKNNSINNQYEVQIAEGTYNIMPYYSDSEINAASFQGLPVLDYVHIMGVGDRDKIILHGELDGTFSTVTKDRVSTVAKFGNGDIDNITVTSTNLRYSVHDDYSGGNITRNVRTSKFIQYDGDANYLSAYGHGCKTGDHFLWEDCEFFSYKPTGRGLSVHNNVTFDLPCELKVVNCKHGCADGGIAMGVQGLASGQNDRLILIGNRFNGKLNFTGSAPWIVTGHSNDKTPILRNGIPYELVGETIALRNDSGVDLVATDIVKRTPAGVDKISATDTASEFFGVVFEDIVAGAVGVIKVGGFVQSVDLTLGSATVGAKIGVVSGALAEVANTEDYVGTWLTGAYLMLK